MNMNLISLNLELNKLNPPNNVLMLEDLPSFVTNEIL